MNEESIPERGDDLNEMGVSVSRPEVLISVSDHPVASHSYDAMSSLLVLFCAILVFFMQCGFALLGAGVVRAKNSLTMLAEGITDFCVGCLAFFAFGYAIMFFYGQPHWWRSFFLSQEVSPVAEIPVSIHWFYQAMFCTACTTIASGALAERMKFGAYLLLTAFVSVFLYPVVGHWIWGGGWLQSEGFVDLSGSTQVHVLGGCIALVGCKMLGPRHKRYGPHGRLKIIAGHAMPLTVLGCFILWFGWFGFNMGSLMSAHRPEQLGRIAINTQLAGCAGLLVSLTFSWIRYGKPDISMALNGALAGLVAVTAGCHVVLPVEACLMGGVAGCIVLLGVPFLDKWRLDDPVGAIVVHGMAGIWGTLAVGLFAGATLVTDFGGETAGLFHGGGPRLLAVQFTGLFCVILFTIIVVFAVLWTLTHLIGIRVSPKGELQGLDIDEFGVDSYNDFQIFSH